MVSQMATLPVQYEKMQLKKASFFLVRNTVSMSLSMQVIVGNPYSLIFLTRLFVISS